MWLKALRNIFANKKRILGELVTNACHLFMLLLQYEISELRKHWHYLTRIANEKVKNLVDALEKIKGAFESIERPKLEMETPTMGEGSRTGNEGKRSLGLSSRISLPSIRTRNSNISKQVDRLESASMSSKNWRDAEAQLAKVRFELELENHHSRDSSMEGLSDWEFDEKFEPRSI